MFLIYFILGIIFYVFIILTLQNFTSYLATIFAKKIYKNQQEIDTDKDESPQKYPIGFNTDCIGVEVSNKEYDQEDYE